MYGPALVSGVMHTMPTSSACVQSCTLIPTFRHCSREVSFPRHRRPSSMMGPWPAPYLPTSAAIHLQHLLSVQR